MKKYLLPILMMAIPITTFAQAWGYDNNRIAISADGNNADDYKDKWLRADPDDWGGTAVAMAIIAKLDKYDQLVHYSYNNFVEGNIAPKDENMMHINAQEGIERLRFNPAVFFDAVEQFDEAKRSLTDELAKSTESDPLYFLHMGPAEFFYQCVKECVDSGHGDALAHVYVISHSGYNNNHLRRTYHHTMDQAIEYSGGKINFQMIRDQNGKWDADVLWNSGKNFEVWHWMLESKDPNIQWLYDCLDDHTHKVADVSDAGLVYYLLTGDELGSPSKFKAMLGDEIVPNSIVKAESISTDVDDMLVFVGQSNTITATIMPKLTSNKRVRWSSSNERVARVDRGVVYGKKSGRVTITATSEDGGLECSVKVEVVKLPTETKSVVLSAMEDFNDLEVEGFVPAYKDNGRKAIAVNAGAYKDMYAASRTIFNGETGLYDLTLTTMKELDGESKYRVRVDGRLVGEFRNETTKKDYDRSYFVAHKVTLRKGDVVQVESNTNSNFRVPEGDAFAFSRGRWTQIEFAAADLNYNESAAKSVIEIEAESAKMLGGWSVVEDDVASNGKYIIYKGVDQLDKAVESESVELKFNVDVAGTYTVKWLMRQPQGKLGSEFANSAWVNFVGAKQSCDGKALDGYVSFECRSGHLFYFGGYLSSGGDQADLNVTFDRPGEYKLKISGRLTELSIDKVILYKGMSFEEISKDI